MREDGVGSTRLAALFPHDDAASHIFALKRRLFAAGDGGALAFPVCVPLFSSSSPLRKDQLKALAARLRAERGTHPFSLESPAVGPSAACVSPLIGERSLSLALFPGGNLRMPISPTAPEAAAIGLESFELRFRVAYVVNLLIRPAGVGKRYCSFEWEIGEPVWLPK